MNNILLSCILLTNLIFLACFAYAFFKIRKLSGEIRGIYQDIVEFITPEALDKPSKLATVCEALSEMVGRSLIASLKAFLMGSKSGEVRAANAETGAGIDASPLGAIVGMLPKSVRSSLIKNPQLLDMAINFMQKRGNSAGAPNLANSPSSNSQVKFKL